MGSSKKAPDRKNAPVEMQLGEGFDQRRSHMSIPDKAWECPPPEDGERPVTLAGAVGLRGGRGVMTDLDRIIERYPWLAVVIMALCCLAVCTADGWWS